MNRFVAIVSVGIAFMLASGPLHAKQLTGGTRALARGDYVAATKSLIPRAERGNANAQARLGFMYEHGFEDLDGHKWEFVHMQGNPPA